MHRRNLQAACTFFLFVLAGLPARRAEAEVNYHVTDLGTLDGVESAGVAINAVGQVTGYSRVSGSVYQHAFLWNPSTPNGTSGAMYDLGTLGGNDSYGAGINTMGQVTGFSEGAAYLWTPTTPNGSMGSMLALGSSSERFVSGEGINDSGQVAGIAYAYAGSSNTVAHVWTPVTPNASSGAISSLGTVGGAYSQGYAINTGGQVVGQSATTDGFLRAFLWTPATPNGATGSMIDLGTLGGRFYSAGWSVNDSGQVTGEANTTDDIATHAFFYDGALHDMGTLGGNSSAGYGINASGLVIGNSQMPGNRTYHAFLWSNRNGMVDLNTLIDPLSGWELSLARAINDAGQIVGTGSIGGEEHAFLLTPVPEPASILLLGAVVAFLVSQDSRRLHRRAEYTNTLTARFSVVRAKWNACALGFSIFLLGGSVSIRAYGGVIRSDFDHDCDVDVADYTHFKSCALGSAIPQLNPVCADARLDADSDVDLDDFAIFQRCYSGEGHAANLNCDPACTGPDCNCSCGQTSCNGICKNTKTDNANCGSCGHACAAGTACQSGSCLSSPCFGGQLLCDGICREVELDPSNCGSCGHQCGPGENCAGGICQSAEFVVYSGHAAASPPPLTITGWRSVRTHSGIGSLSIPLNPIGAGNGINGPTVETRQGGIQRVEIDFNQAVVISNLSAVSVIGQTTISGVLQPSVDYSASASVSFADIDTIALIFGAGALPDETCYHINVAGTVVSQQGASLTGDTDCRVRSLLADATGSGVVNLADALLIRARAGQNATAIPQFDCDLSGGVINISDTLLAKGRVATPARIVLSPYPCAGGATFCSGVCTNTAFDPANCGGCGHVCPDNETCSGGVCQPNW